MVKNREQCGYHFEHDPVTEAPRGRRCDQDAVQEITWKDGRTSVACQAHGIDALDADVLPLVASVRELESK